MTIIDKLRELEAKATPGPWESRGYRNTHETSGTYTQYVKESSCMRSVCEMQHGDTITNAALIAAMRNALPALLRVAEAAKDWSNAEFGQDLNECAALRDAVDALFAREVSSARPTTGGYYA